MNDGDDSLFLDRRRHVRVKFRSSVRFEADPARPLRLAKGVTQNLGPRGIMILSPVVPELEKPFRIWIPVTDHETVEARGRTMWRAIEDTFVDSPYWVRAGLELAFMSQNDRRLVERAVAIKANMDPEQRETATSKVSYIF